MDGEIFVAFSLAGPVWSNGPCVLAKLVRQVQDLLRREVPFALDPRPSLGFCKERPIALHEGEDILSIHVAIIAPTRSTSAFP